MSHNSIYIGIGTALLLSLAPPSHAGSAPFTNPQPVPIYNLPAGHDGTPISTEEPFVSRDGRFLFFNTGKEENNKDLHYAAWQDGRWIYRGELGPKINTGREVEGNPTMDAFNNFYYIDSKTRTMVRRSRFDPATGTLRSVQDEWGVPEREIVFLNRFHGNMGVEVSAAGDCLYFSRATWRMIGFKLGPFEDSDILFSHRQGNGFVYDQRKAERVMQHINTPDMEYAASISADGLELFFTRLPIDDLRRGKVHSQIMRAIRTSLKEPFSKPLPIAAIGNSDFVEGPSIGPNGRELYYHRREGGKFRLYKVTRTE